MAGNLDHFSFQETSVERFWHDCKMQQETYSRCFDSKACGEWELRKLVVRWIERCGMDFDKALVCF